MKKIVAKFLFFSVVCVASMVAAPVFAAEKEDKDVYAGVDINAMAISVEGESLNTFNMRFKLGLDMFPDLIPMLSLESHFGFDLTEDSATINGTDATLHLNHYIGLYVKASHEIEDVVSFYGLLGFAATQMQGDTAVLKDETVTGLSFGLGAGFAMPWDLEGNVEVMQLVNGDAFDVMMLSFGVRYRM